MSEILLSHEVIIYLLSEGILYALLLVAVVATGSLLRGWDFEAFTPKQFALENRSYLVMTIILFVMMLKVLLLPYFVYTIDSLASLIPGAMCGAGVIKANRYGNPLLTLKLIILLLSGLWLTLNWLDLHSKHYPYLRAKSWFFVGLFGLLSLEFGLDILYFTHIETIQPVSCCSVIFGSLGGGSGLPLGLDIPKVLWLFYLLFALVVLSGVMESLLLGVVSTLLFATVAYYAVVYFFGTYIYELPTHQCPFCMLQDHYFYVGYLVWGLLLVGVFLRLNSTLLGYLMGHSSLRLTHLSTLLLGLFTLLCSAFVALYYLKNGVLL